MIISVASGKGGTGKTTFATNLSISLDNVQFFDCDVEEPNSNIFLKAELDHKEDVLVEIPKIDEGRCDFCGKCSDFCMYNALAVVPKKTLVFPELCHSCGGCSLVCPNDAISWDKRSIGVLEYGSVDSIDFFQGLLNVGEMQAVPVIKALKKKIDPSCNVVIDAPPGTSCPVIETINSSDFCILVTESTPFGFHDLKLAVDVVRHLDIPFGVVINRDGVGDHQVEKFCRTEEIPVLMKIPHSEEIARLYSKGIPFVKELPDWKNKFRDLFEKIQSEVKQF